MKRASAFALALCAGCLALARPEPVVANSADAMLLAAAAPPAGLSYTGTVQVVRIGDRSAEAAVYRIEHRPPDLTRRVYESPASLAGDSVVSNGNVSFAIDAHRHRIVETRNDAAGDSIALDANFAILRDNYRIVGKGIEVFDGRRTDDVMLVSKRTGRPAMFVRIDHSSKIVLDKQEFGPSGALVSELRFDTIRYGADLPSTDFALPKRYELVRGPVFAAPSERLDRVVQRAGFSVREPRALPEGFAVVEGSVVEMRGIRTVHLLYSDGIHTISLFESAAASTLDASGLSPRTVSVAGHSAQYAEDATTALLAWSDGTLYYTLVGDLGLVDLPEIAAQIERP
jgi:negative regulator of sigma E activity